MNAKVRLAALAAGFFAAGLTVAEARSGCPQASVHKTAAKHARIGLTGAQLAQANATVPRGRPSQGGRFTSRQNAPVPSGTPRQ
jgi:hypothetical protein